MRFQVHLGNGIGAPPTGYVEIQDPRVVERLKHCVIVPELVKKPDEDEYRVARFSLIPREQVDTRPLEEISNEL